MQDRNSALWLSTSWLLAAFFYCTFLIDIGVHAAPSCGLVPPKSARDLYDPGSANNNNPGTGVGGANTTYEEVVMTGWYPGWLATQVPPESLLWDKFTHLTYAFALTDSNGNIILNSDDTQVLPRFVQAANDHGVKALVSVGGWTGSRFFSTAVATPENRTSFVQAVTRLADTYKLDGIDFDWEYPNKQGIGCNAISPDDSNNFLLFLQQLRNDPLGEKLYLSAAVGITPFAGPDGSPMADVSEFAKVLDHIAIMNYDIWGPWSTGIGPNAPLDDSCAPTQVGSGKSAVQSWTAAKFPANQIVLGVAAYGHSFLVTDQSSVQDASGQLKLYSPFTKNNNPLVPADDGGGVDICGNPTGGGGTDVYDFTQMTTAGFLNDDGSVAQGISYTFDNCSQTPFVYNPTSGVVISYDDTTSFAAKGRFINDNALKGLAMWHVVGDPKGILLNAISEAIGVEVICP